MGDNKSRFLTLGKSQVCTLLAFIIFPRVHGGVGFDVDERSKISEGKRQYYCWNNGIGICFISLLQEFSCKGLSCFPPSLLPSPCLFFLFFTAIGLNSFQQTPSNVNDDALYNNARMKITNLPLGQVHKMFLLPG